MSNKERQDKVPFRQGKLRDQLISASYKAIGDEKTEITAQMKLLEMSEKDKKHVVILGKAVDLIRDTLRGHPGPRTLSPTRPMILWGAAPRETRDARLHITGTTMGLLCEILLVLVPS